MKKDIASGIMYNEWRMPIPGAVFLLVHGLGGYSERWKALAEFLYKRNISSYAIELKGFGETSGVKGHVDSFDIYLNDIRRLREIIAKENPGKKVFLLGESLGGLFSFLLAIQSPELFNGLICLAPAFKSIIHFSMLDYLKIFASYFFNPRKQFCVPFTAGMCTQDLEYQAQMEEDPREHRLASAKLLVDTLLFGIKASFIKNRLRTPTLFLLPGKDVMIDAKTSKKIFDGLLLNDKALREYPTMRHALSIELGREKVFEDIVGWMREHMQEKGA